MSHGLFGDLSALHGQFKNLTSTIQARKALDLSQQWSNEYARHNGWGPPRLDFIAATRKGAWQGVPTAEPATRVDMGTSLATEDGTVLLEIADAILWRAKMTGIGMAKHPTWVGESLVLAALVDTRAGRLAPFSAVCQSILPPMQSLVRSAFGKPGVYLGKTKEVRIGDELPDIEDFRLYSAAPNTLDRKIHQRLAAALDGWTGHLRLQTFESVGLFLAWNWRGDDRKKWSADADRVISVLQQVRDAFLGLPAATSGQPAAVKAPLPGKGRPQPAPPSFRRQPSGEPSASSSAKPKRTPVPKNPARPQGSGRRPDTDGAELIRLRYSVSNKNQQGSGGTGTCQDQYFRLPPGMSARVEKWLVRPGDAMIKDQPIVRVTLTSGGDGRLREVVLTAPVGGCRLTRRRGVGTELTGRSVVAHVSGIATKAGSSSSRPDR